MPVSEIKHHMHFQLAGVELVRLETWSLPGGESQKTRPQMSCDSQNLVKA